MQHRRGAPPAQRPEVGLGPADGLRTALTSLLVAACESVGARCAPLAVLEPRRLGLEHFIAPGLDRSRSMDADNA